MARKKKVETRESLLEQIALEQKIYDTLQTIITKNAATIAEIEAKLEQLGGGSGQRQE